MNKSDLDNSKGNPNIAFANFRAARLELNVQGVRFLFSAGLFSFLNARPAPNSPE